MSQRTQVMIALARHEEQLWNQQAQVSKHRRYFKTLLHDSNLMVPALLLPSFIMGWKIGRLPRASLMLRQFSEFVMLSLLASVRRSVSAEMRQFTKVF